MSDDTYNLALKVPMAVIERLDALVPDVAAEYQHLQAAGLIRKISRSTVARLVLDAGLEAMEAKYNAPTPKAPPPTKTPTSEGATTRKTEPADDEPESALIRAYGGRKPSRRSKPATVGGKLLRQWRESSGLSQAQAAERFGATQPTWGRWERGESKPTKAARAELEGLVEDLDPEAWTTPNTAAGEED